MEGEGTGVFLDNGSFLLGRRSAALAGATQVTDHHHHHHHQHHQQQQHLMTSGAGRRGYEQNRRQPEAASWSNGKSKHTQHMSGSGPRMHAMFINYRPQTTRSCGTGFFLPRTGYYHMQQPTGNTLPTNSVSAPVVLLPSHVVQALNLNEHVHPPLLVNPPKEYPAATTTAVSALPPPVAAPKVAAGGEDYTSGGSSTPLEILLPEEWSY